MIEYAKRRIEHTIKELEELYIGNITEYEFSPSGHILNLREALKELEGYEDD